MLSIIIPVYNEADNIKLLVKKIKDSLKNYKYEVLFINDGSGRKFITKSDPGWNYCQNDDTLDDITSTLIQEAVKTNHNISLLPKKEREGVNKVIKVNNDYSKQKETLTNKILENEMCKYTIQESE